MRWRSGSGTSPPSRKTPSGLPPSPSGETKTSRTCSRGTGRPSENRQEVLDLVRSDLHAVVLPLLALDLDEALERVLAERAQDQLGLGRDLDRLAQRLGKLLDPALGALLRGQVVEVLLHRLGQLVALLDALESGVQHPREAQVGIAGGVGTAQLSARRALLAGVV